MNTMQIIPGMSATLRIQPSAKAMRDAVAWYLPCPDPRAWLTAMGQMGVAMELLRVMVLPISAQDRSPRGVVVAASDHQPLAKPQALCEAYGIEAGVLYLPTHARLLPAVSSEECRQFILAPAAVFHPIAGLIAFEQRDLLSAFDLIEKPQPHEVSWNMARPGVALNSRLLAVMPDQVPTLEQLDQDLRDDIGTQPLSDLPAPIDEPKDSALSSASKAVARGFLSAIRAFGNALTGRSRKSSKDSTKQQNRQTSTPANKASGPGLGGAIAGMIGRIAAWADAAIEKLSPEVRQRELDRL